MESRRLGMGKDLIERPPAEPVLAAGGSLGDLLRRNLRTDLFPELQI